jgi:hypothetical protein
MPKELKTGRIEIHFEVMDKTLARFDGNRNSNTLGHRMERYIKCN